MFQNESKSQKILRNIESLENFDLECLLPFLCKDETAVSKDCSGPKTWPRNQATMLKVKSDVCPHQEPGDPLISP